MIIHYDNNIYILLYLLYYILLYHIIKMYFKNVIIFINKKRIIKKYYIQSLIKSKMFYNRG